MFGAEGFLMDRCQNVQVFEKAVKMINGFKEYFISHNGVVYDNPSPGNKQGGITTLEDKSCGCVQKGGSAPIMDVIDYGEPCHHQGSEHAVRPRQRSGQCHRADGRRCPHGAVQHRPRHAVRRTRPTLKIATNSQLAAKKKDLDRLQRRCGRGW